MRLRSRLGGPWLTGHSRAGESRWRSRWLLRTAPLPALAQLDPPHPRVGATLRGPIGDVESDADLALSVEHPPRPAPGANREAHETRRLRAPPGRLDPLPPNPELAGTRDLHRESGDPPPEVALQLTEPEQVADARRAAVLAEALDSVHDGIRNVDRAAGVGRDGRGGDESTGAILPSAGPTTRRRGTDLEPLSVPGDDSEAEGTREGAGGRELADPAVVGVGDVDGSGRVGTEAQHEAQLPGAAARDAHPAARGPGADLESLPAAGSDVEAPGPNEGPFRRELADTEVEVGNVDVSCTVGGDAVGVPQRTGPAAGLARSTS